MDLELSNLQEQRRRKADQLRELGIDPYAPRAARSHTTAEAIAHFTEFEATNATGADDELDLTLAGRLVSRRDMGKTVFAHIRDGHGQIQLYLRVNDLGRGRIRAVQPACRSRRLRAGDWTLFRTRTGEISLRVREFTILTKALNAPPEKWHGLQDVEIRYRQRYADLIANADVRRVFEIRSRMITRDPASFSTATASSRSRRRRCNRSTAARRPGRSRPTTTRSIRRFICASPTSST